MWNRRCCVALALLFTLASQACARHKDDAPPVAIPSVALSRTTVPAGHLIDVRYTFVVAPDAPAFTEDYVVFVHAVDEDGDDRWVDDHEPPVPTSRWMPGDRIEYSRAMFVPRRAYPGRFSLDVGLYSRRTGDRRPLRATQSGRRSYRLANFDVTSTGLIPAVLFVKGWHDPESAPAHGTLLSNEWHWSTQEALLWCPNPRRDALFVLRFEQPLSGPDTSREVEVRIGGSVVDRFTVQPVSSDIRRISLSRAQLGTDDVVPITVAVDRTVVPAHLSESGSSDTRALGVRVYDAFLEAREARN